MIRLSLRGLIVLAALTAALMSGVWSDVQARGQTASNRNDSIVPTSQANRLIGTRDLRRVAVHDAGDLYSPFGDGIISDGFYSTNVDPETGGVLYGTTFPNGSKKRYVYSGGIWIGGIAGADTLVSVAMDGWFNYREFLAENPDLGGTRRTGDYADDEFITIALDTLAGYDNTPLTSSAGFKMVLKSYSWADSIYDDFILLEYTIHNVGPRHFTKAYAGVYMDCDIYYNENATYGYNDDLSGSLDTLLYDGDSASRVLIPYSFDNDGDPDPVEISRWESISVPDVISLGLVESSFPVERVNFNWWFPHYQAPLDYGPRRVGTPEAPLRLFQDDNLGTPITDGDKYYIMSHPEVDYNQIEAAIHGSGDGWIPSPSPDVALDFANGYDTRFLYSFGPFDLAPGDSVSFVLALVAGRAIHRYPSDFAFCFEPKNPAVFQRTLDFSDLMRQHRRADSVYRSGMLLPHPGPPQGLTISEYDDAYVKLAWNPSHRPDVKGYFLNQLGQDGAWYHTTYSMLHDTSATFLVLDPRKIYQLGVSLVDTRGRESKISIPVSVLPGMPHPPRNLTVTADGLCPVLSWQPGVDTAMQAFLIYRAIWSGPYLLYDSTAALTYRDHSVLSGIQYRYLVSAKNNFNLESEKVGPVTFVSMARNKGLLFYNMNKSTGPNAGPYRTEYTDRLYQSVAALTPAARRNYNQGSLSFHEMADYAVIIMDWEQRESGISMGLTDSLYYYLANGGRVAFIMLGTENIMGKSRTYRFGDGDFFHDILKLDSSVVQGWVLQQNAFYGDLYGCRSLIPRYLPLYADTTKFAGSYIPIIGYIPVSGYLFPTAEAEPIYRYISSNPDSVNHGQINGIRYLGDDYRFVFLNFPLSMMREPADFYVMRQVLIDLGVDMSCGDALPDGAVNLGDIICIINYLYRNGKTPDMAHADVDGSGAVDLGDAVALINFVLRQTGWLHCNQ